MTRKITCRCETDHRPFACDPEADRRAEAVERATLERALNRSRMNEPKYAEDFDVTVRTLPVQLAEKDAGYQHPWVKRFVDRNRGGGK